MSTQKKAANTTEVKTVNSSLLNATPVVKQVDMPVEMRAEAFKITKEAIEQQAIQKDQASYIKSKFDAQYGSSWQCIVGRKYGCSITHATQYLIFFTLGDTTVLLFKSYE